MKDYAKEGASYESFFDAVKEGLAENFNVQEASLKDCGSFLQAPHRKKTAWIDV